MEEILHTRKCFYIGGKYEAAEQGTVGVKGSVMIQQMCVEELKPANVTKPHPIIFWPGMCQTGVSWLTTPDGRPGWASYFLKQGWTVYLVDPPERGRSAWLPSSSTLLTVSSEYAEKFWTATQHNGGLWPQAELLAQWPGTGQKGDPAFDAFMACQVQSRNDYLATETLAQQLGAELLRKIGPAILCTHSQGGSHGWAMADSATDFVRAIVAVEPAGPPFVNRIASAVRRPDPGHVVRPYGITMVPITYEPPISEPSVLSKVTTPSTDSKLCDLILQAEPPRRLAKLSQIPVLIVTSESGYHAHYDYATINYLKQAGVQVDWLNLPEVGVKGNGHFMFMEKNNIEVAENVHKWLLTL